MAEKKVVIEFVHHGETTESDVNYLAEFILNSDEIHDLEVTVEDMPEQEVG